MSLADRLWHDNPHRIDAMRHGYSGAGAGRRLHYLTPERGRIGKGWWIALAVVLAMLAAPVAYHAARALDAHTEAETAHVE